MSVKDFLDSKNISIYNNQTNIVSEDYKLYNLTSLLNEYATLYSQKYLCYSKAIELIDESETLKELEVKINRFFK